MTALLLVGFWLPVTILVWVYAGYPSLAWLVGRLRPVRLSSEGSGPQLVTVALAVHDGAADVGARMRNILDQDVPFEVEIIVASDGSTDSTVATVQALADADPRIRLLDLPRQGQSAAQAQIFAAAGGEVIVLTDVQTRFAPGCLAALVAPFGDARVGCVTGVLTWHFDARTNTARHEGMYWRYEQTVRSFESRAGWLAAGTGALLAVRRSIYRAARAHASLDQMLPLYSRAAGRLVLVAAKAVGSDRGTASPAEQFASRVRIATQGIEANLRESRRILPWRQPGPFLALWSHKVLRWATPYLGALATLCGLVLFAEGSGAIYAAPLLIAFITALLAALAVLGARIGRAIPFVGFALTVLTVNAAFALAWVNVVFRRRIPAWSSVAQRNTGG